MPLNIISFDWIKYAYYFQYLTFGPLGSSKKSDRLDKDEYISEQYLFFLAAFKPSVLHNFTTLM
jgi:hypothetical protein